MKLTLGDSEQSVDSRRPSTNGQGAPSADRYAYSISVDRNGHFRWTLFGPSGQIVAASNVGFVSELTAERALWAEAERRRVEVVPRFGKAA